MTTTPVMTITDEQIAEIEAAAEINAYVTNPWRFEGLATASAVSALISRLRAAEKDVARMEWIEDNYHGDGGGNYFNMRLRFERDIDDCGSIRGLIDAAMEQSK